jgi:hypothetical protein
MNAKVGREDIFKPTIGNESSHEISIDNGVRVVNFATSKNLVVKSSPRGVLCRLKITQQSHLCQSLVPLRLRSLSERLKGIKQWFSTF